MSRELSRRAVGLVLVAALSGLLMPVAHSAEAKRTCTELDPIPVALKPGTVKNLWMYAQLCEPAGRAARTVLLLVHGVAYDHTYWNFPDPADGPVRYDYTASANEAGYATLSVDRIGATRSSKPLGTDVTIDAGAYTLSQVLTALQTGGIRNGHGDRFDNVVYVGHSMGSVIGWVVASDYGNADAFVFTGATHKMASEATQRFGEALHPIPLDPQLKDGGTAQHRQQHGGWDASYLTTRPGSREKLFYAPATVERSVMEYDEAHAKSSMSAGESGPAYRTVRERVLDIRKPVLLVMGENDWAFCSPPGTNAANCSDAEALEAEEGCRMGAHVPSVHGFVLGEAGHMLNQARTSVHYFRKVNDWVGTVVGPGFVPRKPRC